MNAQYKYRRRYFKMVSVIIFGECHIFLLLYLCFSYNEHILISFAFLKTYFLKHWYRELEGGHLFPL